MYSRALRIIKIVPRPHVVHTRKRLAPGVLSITYRGSVFPLFNLRHRGIKSTRFEGVPCTTVGQVRHVRMRTCVPKTAEPGMHVHSVPSTLQYVPGRTRPGNN